MLRDRESYGAVNDHLTQVSLLSVPYFEGIYPWSTLMTSPTSSRFTIPDNLGTNKDFLIVSHDGLFSRIPVLAFSQKIRNRKVGELTATEEYLRLMLIARNQLGLNITEKEPESVCITPVLSDILAPLSLYQSLRYVGRIISGLERSILVYTLSALFNPNNGAAKSYWQVLCNKVRTKINMPTLFTVRMDILLEALSWVSNGVYDPEYRIREMERKGFISFGPILVGRQVQGIRGVYPHYLINPCAFS